MPLPTPTTTLTQARDILATLRQAYQEFAAGNYTVSRYQINGREMEYRDTGAILKDISYWERQVAALEAAEGQTPKQRIYMRL